MKKIYVFGNEFLEEDSFAKKIADRLEGYEFIKCDDPSQILGEKDLVIMDVVRGIDDPQLLTVDQLKDREIVSGHDLDLQFFLKLLDQLGDLKVKIIGVPVKGDEEEIVQKVTQILK